MLPVFAHLTIIQQRWRAEEKQKGDDADDTIVTNAPFACG
jgi:hypothetical protein